MKRKTKVLALAGIVLMAAFLAFMCTGAFAANPSTVTVSANVASVLQLSMSKATVDFGSGVTALQPGSTYTDSVTATVDSNKIWSLKVTKSGDLTFGAFTIPSANLTYGSTTTNPANVLNLQAAGTLFLVTPTNICNTCNRGGSLPVTINYSLTVPWSVDPGTYTATHTYTVSQP